MSRMFDCQNFVNSIDTLNDDAGNIRRGSDVRARKCRREEARLLGACGDKQLASTRRKASTGSTMNTLYSPPVQARGSVFRFARVATVVLIIACRSDITRVWWRTPRSGLSVSSRRSGMDL